MYLFINIMGWPWLVKLYSVYTHVQVVVEIMTKKSHANFVQVPLEGLLPCDLI